MLFAIRGLLAFVAFTEFVNAFRSFLDGTTEAETESYVRSKLFKALKDVDSDVCRLVSHVYGLFCVLNGLVVLNCAVFAHFRSNVWLTISAVGAKFGFIVVHAFVFESISAGDNLVFPLASALLALLGASAIPFCLREPSRELPKMSVEEENAILSRGFPKKFD